MALALALMSLLFFFSAQARQLDPGSRQLLSSAKCPAGCSPEEGCVQDATGGGLRCGNCVGNLLLLRDSGVCGESCSPILWCSPCLAACGAQTFSHRDVHFFFHFFILHQPAHPASMLGKMCAVIARKAFTAQEGHMTQLASPKKWLAQQT